MAIEGFSLYGDAKIDALSTSVCNTNRYRSTRSARL
jgi:hypothetical protein